jgi:hypothetical protein
VQVCKIIKISFNKKVESLQTCIFEYILKKHEKRNQNFTIVSRLFEGHLSETPFLTKCLQASSILHWTYESTTSTNYECENLEKLAYDAKLIVNELVLGNQYSPSLTSSFFEPVSEASALKEIPSHTRWIPRSMKWIKKLSTSAFLI